MRVQVTKKPYPGKIIRDLSDADMTDIPQIALDASELAKQLHIPQKLVDAYVTRGEMHEAKPGEIVAGLGMCGEELAAFAVMGFLMEKKKAPFVNAGIVMEQVKRLLFAHTVSHTRVVVMAVESNKKRVQVQAGEIPKTQVVRMDKPEFQKYMTIIDVSALCSLIDIALWTIPLKLPRVEDCIVDK